MKPAAFHRLLRLIAVLSAGLPSARAIPPPGFEPIENGHVDFSFCFENGVWKTGLVWEVNGNPVVADPAAGALRPPEQAVLIAKDQRYQPGNRVRRPSGAAWNFTGVGAGEPFWWFPQSNWNGVWPGFSICGDCASWFEDDPRVLATGPWKVVTLKKLRYIGKGDGRFSMWSTGTFGDLTVWMTTSDGVSEYDRYYVGAAGHAHPAMGFSALGLYEVTFDVTCYGGPGKENPQTSPEVSYYFAVGTHWEWIARHFQPERWWQPGYIGELDDPDEDGVPNLIEYACGLHPREPDRSETTGGGFPGLPAPGEHGGLISYRFPLRDPATNPQIDVVVRATDDLAAAPWPQELAPSTAPGPVGWFDAVCARPFSAPRLFLRMEVTLLPELFYSD